MRATRAITKFREEVGSLQRFVRRGRVRVMLYSKPDCPLCVEADDAVKRAFMKNEVTVVNILGNRELEDEYIFRIPVLALGNIVLAEGIIDLERARRARKRALTHSFTRNDS